MAVFNSSLLHHSLGLYPARKLQVPSNVILWYLPPHSPELIIVEEVWDWIRNKYTRGKLFTTLNDLIDTLCEALSRLAGNPQRVRSITDQRWLYAMKLSYNGISRCSSTLASSRLTYRHQVRQRYLHRTLSVHPVPHLDAADNLFRPQPRSDADIRSELSNLLDREVRLLPQRKVHPIPSQC